MQHIHMLSLWEYSILDDSHVFFRHELGYLHYWGA